VTQGYFPLEQLHHHCDESVFVLGLGLSSCPRSDIPDGLVLTRYHRPRSAGIGGLDTRSGLVDSTVLREGRRL